ncbi:MAG: SLC13 family permease [Promethearchaeota archaeon]
MLEIIPFTIIMLIVYFLVASEKVNKSITAISGAAATIIVAYVFHFFGGVTIFTEKQILTELVDWDAIIIIISLLVIVEVSKSSGILNYLTIKIIKLTKGNTTRILLYTNLLTYFIAIILGDASSFLVVGSITLILVKNLKLDPFPYLLTEFVSVNAASLATVTSSVTNIIVTSYFSFAPEYYLSYDRFLLVALPFSLLIFAINLVIGRWLIRDRFICLGECITESEIEVILGLSEYEVVKKSSLVPKFLVLFIGLIVGFFIAGFFGIPFFIVPLIGAIFFLIVSGEYTNTDKILKRIDWSMLIFFFGIFVVVGGVARVGLLSLIGDAVGRIAGGNIPLIALMLIIVCGIVAAFVDGVSIAIILLYIIPSIVEVSGIANPTIIIWSVLFAVNLGDIIAPLGGISSVIVYLMFKKEGIKFSFLKFMKIGGTLSVINFMLAFLYILLVSNLLGW